MDSITTVHEISVSRTVLETGPPHRLCDPGVTTELYYHDVSSLSFNGCLGTLPYARCLILKFTECHQS